MRDRPRRSKVLHVEAGTDIRVIVSTRSQRQRRFRMCKGIYLAWRSGPHGEAAVTTAQTWRQQASRAFAAELLAPADLLKERTAKTGLTPHLLDRLANEWVCPTQAIVHQAENHGVPLGAYQFASKLMPLEWIIGRIAHPFSAAAPPCPRGRHAAAALAGLDRLQLPIGQPGSEEDGHGPREGRAHGLLPHRRGARASHCMQVLASAHPDPQKLLSRWDEIEQTGLANIIDTATIDGYRFALASIRTAVEVTAAKEKIDLKSPLARLLVHLFFLGCF